MLLLEIRIIHLLLTKKAGSAGEPFMKRITLFFLFLVSFYAVQSQPGKPPRKYPSILWEITGNGMKKPSYLIGTMHVSSKIAFNLPDSFYIAVRSAQMVALETNPETWQEDMSKYDLGESGYGDGTDASSPAEYLTLSTLKFFKYDNKIERGLFSSPSTINNLLYRSYGQQSADFEEDTYLDMYIYQCGKKWGKKVSGVEEYGESMRLMAEAYKDAAKEKNRKERSYDDMAEEYSADKLQEAYRKGDLDLLDSINQYNSFSAAFDEKFLYRRNEIQASSIDSILRSGTILFVGVGAAHLPGDRGVIEMLRAKGYKLRPVKMGERASKEKDGVDKLRVPVSFKTAVAADGFYKVDIPGKFYKSGDDMALDQQQYADMANGSYYMVTRIMTNAWMWNHQPDDVLRKVDSLLYENVPGKILTKTPIIKNGYKGYDIVNRTRRGDMQRYNIFVTPFEVLFFKMSGNGDYVKGGEEAKKFFGSIQLKEYTNGGTESGWKKYSPVTGGFAVDFPHLPYQGNDGSWIWDAVDKTNGSQFRLVRTDIHHFGFAEEDTFDLGLMEESFMASEFIDSALQRKQTQYKGYPALDAKYRDKQGGLFTVRYILQGPHYYTLVAHGKQEVPEMQRFLNSFEIKPLVYAAAKAERDTSLYFSVQTPVFPVSAKIKLDMPRYSGMGGYGNEEEEETEDQLLESGAYRNKIIANDSTGEKIYVSFYKSSRYHYTKDSSRLYSDSAMRYMNDSTWIIKKYSRKVMPDNRYIWDMQVTDTGSSRSFWYKVYYKDGVTFSLTSQSDTLTPPSDFIRQFYESFTPADTLKGVNPFAKKSVQFFEDLGNSDSVIHKKALSHIQDIYLDSSDFGLLRKAIESRNWKEKKYLNTKKQLIYKLGQIKTPAAADYLKDLYYNLGDTVQLVYPVLEALLTHKTPYAFNLFRTIIATEPPVLEKSGKFDYAMATYALRGYGLGNYSINNDDFMDELADSLPLTRTILPDILPLLNLDDYKSPVMSLLGKMADSNQLKPSEYVMYYNKFLLEAKQELKKQSVAEKKLAIQRAEESKEEKKNNRYADDEEEDEGNEDLSQYATLLIPFWDSHPAVSPLISQMLSSNDKKLKYNTLIQLLKKNRPYPDTLLRYFAGLDEYRYTLYTDLRDMKKTDKFPAMYNNHLDLGRSALLAEQKYSKPDSVVYADRVQVDYKDKKGYLYFFTYKTKKDDLSWKLAVVGLVPLNPREFEFVDSAALSAIQKNPALAFLNAGFNRFSFTSFLDAKVTPGEQVKDQLSKEVKKLLFSRRKSARQFYENSSGRDYEDGPVEME